MTKADLDRDGTSWASLTPQLKAELVGLAKERDIEEHAGAVPAGAIRRSPTKALADGIDEQHADASKRATDVHTAYDDARTADTPESTDDLTEELEGSTP